MKPRISIITPSYNQAQFLEQTICSVLDQGYENLEYMVIDGGSIDGSVDIIKKYHRHLHYWESALDRGQSHAINKGLLRATGDVFNWLNSDDYYEPGALSRAAELFSDPGVQVVCGRSRIFKGVDETVKYTNGTDIYAANLAKTLGWARIDQPETFFRTDALKTIGLLNENLHYVMDREWWTRYLLHFGLAGMVSTPEVFVNFRYHENSKTLNHKLGFESESFQLAKALAKSAGETKIYEFIKELSGDGQDAVALEMGEGQRQLVVESLSYALLYLADYYYYSKMNDRVARRCLDLVDIKNIGAEDKELYERLRWRSRFAPVFLRRLNKKHR